MTVARVSKQRVWASLSAHAPICISVCQSFEPPRGYNGRPLFRIRYAFRRRCSSSALDNGQQLVHSSSSGVYICTYVALDFLSCCHRCSHCSCQKIGRPSLESVLRFCSCPFLVRLRGETQRRNTYIRSERAAALFALRCFAFHFTRWQRRRVGALKEKSKIYLNGEKLLAKQRKCACNWNFNFSIYAKPNI